jgi:hypothetical protein
VAEKIGAGTYQLQNLRGEPDALLVNGQALKQYFHLKKKKKTLLLSFILCFVCVFHEFCFN